MDSDSGGLIGLVVSLAAALATVIVALINSRNVRRDVRDNLQRDIELAKQLKDGTRAKDILEEHIARSIRAMAVDSYTQKIKRAQFIFFLLSQSASITYLVKEAIADKTNERFNTLLFVVMGMFGIMCLVTARAARRIREREMKRLKLPHDRRRSKQTPIKLGRLPAATSAAWATLTASSPTPSPDTSGLSESTSL